MTASSKHRRVVAPMLADDPGPAEDTAVPWPVRMMQRFPVLQWVPARAIGIGVLPEHAPDFARRPPLPVVV